MKERLDAVLPGHRPFSLGFFDDQIENIDWIPAFDVVEDDKEFLIEVEIPKVNKIDVSIKVDGDLLTISGKRESEKEDKKKHRASEECHRSILYSPAKASQLMAPHLTNIQRDLSSDCHWHHRTRHFLLYIPLL